MCRYIYTILHSYHLSSDSFILNTLHYDVSVTKNEEYIYNYTLPLLILIYVYDNCII